MSTVQQDLQNAYRKPTPGYQALQDAAKPTLVTQLKGALSKIKSPEDIPMPIRIAIQGGAMSPIDQAETLDLIRKKVDVGTKRAFYDKTTKPYVDVIHQLQDSYTKEGNEGSIFDEIHPAPRWRKYFNLMNSNIAVKTDGSRTPYGDQYSKHIGLINEELAKHPEDQPIVDRILALKTFSAPEQQQEVKPNPFDIAMGMANVEKDNAINNAHFAMDAFDKSPAEQLIDENPKLGGIHAFIHKNMESSAHPVEEKYYQENDIRTDPHDPNMSAVYASLQNKDYSENSKAHRHFDSNPSMEAEHFQSHIASHWLKMMSVQKDIVQKHMPLEELIAKYKDWMRPNDLVIMARQYTADDPALQAQYDPTEEQKKQLHITGLTPAEKKQLFTEVKNFKTLPGKSIIDDPSMFMGKYGYETMDRDRYGGLKDTIINQVKQNYARDKNWYIDEDGKKVYPNKQ